MQKLQFLHGQYIRLLFLGELFNKQHSISKVLSKWERVNERVQIHNADPRRVANKEKEDAKHKA